MHTASITRIRDALLDVLFPPTAREAHVRALTPADLTPVLSAYTYERTPITAFLPYKRRVVREVIWALKYRGMPEAADLLGVLIADHLLEDMAERRHFSDKNPVLVPVPLGRKRYAARTYNQAAFLARAAARHLTDVPVYTDALIRARETAPQTSLGRSARLENMTGAFALSETLPFDLERTHIVIVDDVTTTGATLAAAAAPFIERGASVEAYAAAYS